MKRFYNILIITLVLSASMLIVQGCNHKHDKEEPIIELTIRTRTISYSNSSQYIAVTAKGGWNISSNQTWVTISPSTGSGNYSKIVMTCQENTQEDSRSAIITLTADGISTEVQIVQNGTNSDTPDPHTDETTQEDYGWIELPAFNNRTYKFITHEFGSNVSTGRNFSYLWSKGDLVALWVAYPLNKGLISSGSRTDYWGLDPKLPAEEQPILYGGFSGGYDRGHQLPSADRLSYRDNIMTFYFTNMTPQLNSLNSYIWASLEGQVRSWANKSDTLYVVTGCVVNGSSKKALDNNGKSVTVPVAYYKAILRYMKGSTVGYNGYMALGVFLEHRAYTEKNITKNMSEVMSIDDLEKRLNIDLFPNLEKIVGESTANQIEAEKPSTNNWWWN